MSFLDLLGPIVQWRLRSKDHRRDGALAYIDAVSTDCRGLTEWSGEVTDSSRLVQERLRAYYSFSSVVLGDLFSAEDREIFKNAVASARIYYWIRALEGKNSSEIDILIATRGGPTGKGFTSFSVVERALMAYRDEPTSASMSFEDSVNELRTNCLKDIASLDELRNRFAMNGS